MEDPRTLTSFWNRLSPAKKRNILSSYMQYQVEQGKRGPSVMETPNPLFGIEWCREVDDVLYGICNLNWGTTKGLDQDSLFSVISELPVLSRIEVQNHLCVGERQSQRYMKAAKLVLQFMPEKPRP